MLNLLNANIRSCFNVEKSSKFTSFFLKTFGKIYTQRIALQIYIKNSFFFNCPFNLTVSVLSDIEQLWIGLHDNNMQMDFQWTDHTPVIFTYWHPFEPNNFRNVKEDCVSIWGAVSGTITPTPDDLKSAHSNRR